MPSLHVHYPKLKEGEHARCLREALTGDVQLTVTEEPDVERVTVLVDGQPSPEQLAGLPVLETVVIPWAGLSDKAREALLPYPELRVHNLHHNAAPVAEHALALLLAAARSIVPADRALRAGDWRPRYAASDDPLLAGTEALVIGAGAVGRRVARALEGLDVRPRLVARSARDGVHGIEQLHELLPSAAAVVLALPLTPESEGLLGARELALLPERAVLVNVGRARLVDERALFEALRSGRLRAGLDVWHRYPLTEQERTSTRPSELAFEELDNLVLSPHRAGHGRETPRLRALALAQLLGRLARGEDPGDRVDVQRGY